MESQLCDLTPFSDKKIVFPLFPGNELMDKEIIFLNTTGTRNMCQTVMDN